MNGETIYKCSPDRILLRCVDAARANQLISEIHEGSCGPHMSGHVLARKILQQGCYWLTMKKDCFQHVRKCHLCQIYMDKVNQPPMPLHNLTTLWPFSMWGIDAISVINPKSSNAHCLS